MVLDYNETYKAFIEQLRKDGAKIACDTEIANTILDDFYFDGIEQYIFDEVSMVVIASPANTLEVLRDVTGLDEISDEAFSLFLACTVVKEGNCPVCGGWISDEYETEWEEDDHGDCEAVELHSCSCGFCEKRYDTEDIRNSREWTGTMNTLNLNR